MNDTDIMRRRKSLVLKVMAVGFIILFLVRTDWLADVFINSSQSNHNRKGQLLSGDVMQINDQQRKQNVLREAMTRDEHVRSCPLPHRQNNVEVQSTAAHCQRIQPSGSSCKIAEELFGNPMMLDISKACKTRHDREFCRITGSADSMKATCDISICDEQIYLGITDINNGIITWTPYSKSLQLQRSIKSHIGKDNFGYCHIICSKQQPKLQQYEHDYGEMLLDEEELANYYDGETQILNLPPVLYGSQLKSDSQRNAINLNLIFIDSVSRHHFYRSLPRSVRKLDEIAIGDNMFVLDFELVQAVRSRTYETLQTLFSGSINPFEQPFGTQEMPTERLKIDNLVLPLKELGYTNLWLEDLCPYWEWGLSKDMLVYNKTHNRETLYTQFIETVRRAGIDSVGNTFSSCDILDANNVPDPFHAPEKLCFNGKHQHEYTLSYLETYQRIMTARSQPFISFLETNVGHEGSGKRIQYFDSALASYIEFAKSLDNTLTIVFSDHGNAYGEFLNQATEGRVEMYHPFLFMIIPDSVKSFFSENNLNALKINQNRLVSVLDLHYTITHIIEQLHIHVGSNTVLKSEVSEFNRQFNVSRYGLLKEISPERTCSHMPRIMPNSCICEGYDVSTSNKAYHFILAAYFVGMINNDIQRSKLVDQREQGSIWKRKEIQRGGFGRCQRMKVKKIKNIQESELNDMLTTAKMDLYVETDGQTVDEIFFISIQLKKDFGFFFSGFDRITPYNIYTKCADNGVDLKMCVCKRNPPTKSSNDFMEAPNENDESLENDSNEVKSLLESLLYTDLNSNITSISVYGKECLYIVSQSNKAGAIYEAFNNCKSSFKVKFLFQPDNLLLASGNTVIADIRPYDVTFVTAGVRKSESDWSCALTVSFNR